MGKRFIGYVLAVLIASGFLVSFALYLDDDVSGARESGFPMNEFADEQGLIILPVKAHIIVDESSYYTSSRNRENIVRLFKAANRIWEPANIYFAIEEVDVTEVSFEAIPSAINGNYQELYNHENYEQGMVNVYMTQSLNNINGLALVRADMVLLSDLTTVNDYRTLAHELGHLLGLMHVDSPERLMARGRNGESLTGNEMDEARSKALELSQELRALG